jgi:LysR family hydrogen peroxide-inducible transcriptional activator
MAVEAGILDHTRVIARRIDAPKASREIALVWRRASPRERDFRLLASMLSTAH